MNSFNEFQLMIGDLEKEDIRYALVGKRIFAMPWLEAWQWHFMMSLALLRILIC